MAKTPPTQQPTNEVLRNTRSDAKAKALKTLKKKGKNSKEFEREITLAKNADRAVKRQAAASKKSKKKTSGHITHSRRR